LFDSYNEVVFEKLKKPGRAAPMVQYGFRDRVSPEKWAKDVEINSLKISDWTTEESERWVSKLPEIGNPPAKGVKASTEESVAYLKKKAEWDRQYGVLQRIAQTHNCDLIAV
jgi:hypothetical protein